MPSTIICTARSQLKIAVDACADASTNPTKAHKERARNLAHEFVNTFGQRTLETLTAIEKEIK